MERVIEASRNLWNFDDRFVAAQRTGDAPMQGEVFFDHASAALRPNGEVVIVLQLLKVRGGVPEPVQIVTCREAGALALIDAVARALAR